MHTSKFHTSIYVPEDASDTQRSAPRAHALRCVICQSGLNTTKNVHHQRRWVASALFVVELEYSANFRLIYHFIIAFGGKKKTRSLELTRITNCATEQIVQNIRDDRLLFPALKRKAKLSKTQNTQDIRKTCLPMVVVTETKLFMVICPVQMMHS